MKDEFQAKMLCIQVIEADRWQGEPLHEAIVNKCMELGVAGAIVYRGTAGFGASARIHHAHALSISNEAPITISVVDREEKIQQLLPHLNQMISGGLVVISSVDVIRYSRSQSTDRNA